MRRTIAGWCLLALTAACTRAPAHGPGPLPAPDTTWASVPGSLKPPPPTPFATVDAGGVEAVVPKRWRASVFDSGGSLRQGLVASPDPSQWGRSDGAVPGLELTWVNRDKVRIPSDLYYLAASGPAIPNVASSRDCRREQVHVLVNHRPFSGDPFSPGDYVERGSGTCHRRGHVTRWAYFVAAPGYGPLRNLGIPDAGLYIAVAVVPDSPTAEHRLQIMVRSAQYGTATIAQLLAAARVSARLS